MDYYIEQPGTSTSSIILNSWNGEDVLRVGVTTAARAGNITDQNVADGDVSVNLHDSDGVRTYVVSAVSAEGGSTLGGYVYLNLTLSGRTASGAAIPNPNTCLLYTSPSPRDS